MTLVKQRKAIFATQTESLRNQLKIKKRAVKLLWGYYKVQTALIHCFALDGLLKTNYSIIETLRTLAKKRLCFQSHAKAIYTFLKKNHLVKTMT